MAKNQELLQLKPPQPRIEPHTMALMAIVAFYVDILQGIFTATLVGMVITPILTFFAWLTFYVWFKYYGITMMDSLAKMIIVGSGVLIELVPGLNVIPAWTLSVLLSLMLIRVADRRKLEEFNSAVKTLGKKLA